MAIRIVRFLALALLLTGALAVLPSPAQARRNAPVTPPAKPLLQADPSPRLPAGPLSGAVGTPLLVQVRKDLTDSDYPFSLQVDVLKSPSGAKLGMELESHSMFLEADAAGAYTIRVRGIQQRSVG